MPKLLNLIESAQNKLNKEILAENFNGIITNKFVDKLNHDQCVIIINNTIRFELYKREHFHYMGIGDSIIKMKNEYTLNVFKKDSTCVFNLKTGNDSNESD